jgi:hypothetical protein
MQNVECVICNLNPRPDMTPYVCSNGHQICGPCGHEINTIDNCKNCPLCRQVTKTPKHFPRMFQTYLIILSQNFIFNCINNLRGCSVTGLFTELGPHEKICKYQKMKCFYSKCREFDRDTCLERMNIQHRSCFSVLHKKNDGYFQCNFRFSALVNGNLGLLRLGEIFKPKMLNLDNDFFKKRVFVCFMVVKEGLEVWLRYEGEKSIVPQFPSKKYCLMFTFESLDRPSIVSAFLELNYRGRIVPNKFLLSKQKLLDWNMWGRMSTPFIRKFQMTLYFE